VNKAELIDAVAGRLGHSKRDVTDIVDAFIEETKKAVVRGEKVAVSGFGVFESQARKARLGRNPRTGETVKIKATKLPKFRPGTEFKAVVSGARHGVQGGGLGCQEDREQVGSGEEGSGQEGSGQEGSGQEGSGQEGSGQEGSGQEGSGQEGSGQEGRQEGTCTSQVALTDEEDLLRRYRRRRSSSL